MSVYCACIMKIIDGSKRPGCGESVGVAMTGNGTCFFRCSTVL